jgi:hypothetical protein
LVNRGRRERRKQAAGRRVSKQATNAKRVDRGDAAEETSADLGRRFPSRGTADGSGFSRSSRSVDVRGS